MGTKKVRLTLDDVSCEGVFTEEILLAQEKIKSFCQNERSEIWISESEMIAGLASRALDCAILLNEIFFIERYSGKSAFRLDGKKNSKIIYAAKKEMFKTFADQMVSKFSIDNNSKGYRLPNQILHYLRKSRMDLMDLRTLNFFIDKLLSPDFHFFGGTIKTPKAFEVDQYDFLFKVLKNQNSEGHPNFRMDPFVIRVCLFLYTRVLPITLPINPLVLFRIDSTYMDLSKMFHPIIEHATSVLYETDISRRQQSTKKQKISARQSRLVKDICLVIDDVGLGNMPKKPNPLFEKMDKFWKEIRDNKTKLGLSYTPPYNLEVNNAGNPKGARTFVDDLKAMKVASGEKRTLTVNYQKIINLAPQINSK